MKLRPREVAAGDHGGKRPAIIGNGEEVGVVGEAEMIAVDKIGVGAGLDPGEQRMGSPLSELVPSHMRDFEPGVGRFDCDYLAAEPTEALDGLEFPAAIRHQLHADAESRETGDRGRTPLL